MIFFNFREENAMHADSVVLLYPFYNLQRAFGYGIPSIRRRNKEISDKEKNCVI